MIAVLINQHSSPLSSVQGITIMNTMKQQSRGDLVKVAAVGIQGHFFNPGYEDMQFNMCTEPQVVQKQLNVVIVKMFVENGVGFFFL